MMIGTAVETSDAKLKSTPPSGQEIIDSLTSLRLIAPHLDSSLHTRLSALLPPIILALQSSYGIIRYTAARCFAALCDVMIDEAMKATIDGVVPLIGDARRVNARQGAVEAVHRELFLA
jgi:TATA-binding protein-associated factor